MTDRNMTNFAKTVATPQQMIDGGDYEGNERVRYDEILTNGTDEVTGAKLYCGKLLPGERFLGGTIIFEAMGTSRTLQVGDSVDDDRYLVATSAAAAGSAQMVALAGFGYKNPSTGSPLDIFVKVAGGTLAATKIIRTVMKFVRD